MRAFRRVLQARTIHIAVLSGITLLAVTLALTAVVALADDTAGAAFTYNPGTLGITLSVKNGIDSGSSITGISFTLPGGTQISGTPSGGGGNCSAATPQDGICTYASAKGPGVRTPVFIDTTGIEPVSIDVTVTFADLSNLNLTANLCGTIGLTPDTLPDPVGNTFYSQQLGGTGGTSPYTFSLQGVVPSGLTLASNGLLSGTTTAVGAFSFQAVASDSNGCQQIKLYSATVQPETENKADLSISVAAGVFFEDPEGNEVNQLFLVAKAVGLLVFDSSPEVSQPGFHSIAEAWQNDEDFLIGVDLNNLGPNTATYNVDVSSSRPLTSGPTYAGYVQNPSSSVEQHIVSGFPAQITPSEHQVLIYKGKWPDAGNISITATITSSSPQDPNSANNSNTFSTVVLQRPAFRKIVWISSLGSGQIGGVVSETETQKAARVKKAAPKVEIAVVKIAGETCAWVTGKKGSLGSSSVDNCSHPVFLKTAGFLNTKGGKVWKYKFRKAPPAGKYIVLTRLAAGELSDREFSKQLKNAFSIRIRK